MTTRTLTIASFFSVAMAATLLGALVHDPGPPARSRPRRPTPRRPVGPRRAPRAAGSASASRPSATSRGAQRRASSTSTPRRSVPAAAIPSTTSSADDIWSASSASRRPTEAAAASAPDPDEPRLGLRDRQGRLHPDQPARDRGGRRDLGHLPGRQDATTRRSSARTRARTSRLLKIEPTEPLTVARRSATPTRPRSASG